MLLGRNRPRPARVTPARAVSAAGSLLAVATLMGVLVAGLAIPFVAVTGVGTRSVADSMDALPEELTADPLAQRTRVLAADGSLLATWFDQNRVNVPLDEVALVMRKAIVAIEDYRFYQHGALDLKGTLRAFITNQANAGVVQGGSSITQQMVKQTLVNQAETPEEVAAATAETYERKFRELRYAIAFEEKYSKDWILERYLNVSYFGDGAHGIEAAARHYFSKPAAELDLREAALLAGLVKNPSLYDPTDNRAEATARRNVVIARMAELNVISRREAREASKAPLGLRVSRTSNGCVGVRGEFFCDYVREWLAQDPALGRTPQQRRELLNTGGLTIETTLDPRFQVAADQAVQERVFPRDQAVGAVAMVVPGTGEVRALAQSRPMGSDRGRGETFLNYTVPTRFGDANGFQPGSTFKVFVLAAAIKQGIPLSTRIPSPQTISLDGSEFITCDGSPAGDWSPGNSTGQGTYNLYTGTQQSVNTFYAQLEAMTELCDPVTLARDMQIEVPEEVSSFALGVADSDPLTMSAAYATFAARGVYCEPKPVARVLSAQGNVIADYPDKCRQLMPDYVADAVNDVLRGVQEPGGFGYNNGIALSQVSAGKTGTTNETKAVWFIGYTPSLSAAAALGGTLPSGTQTTLIGKSIGGVVRYDASGSGTAGPIWAAAMRGVEGLLPDEDFVPPDPTQVTGRPVRVPDVTGLSASEAALELREAGLIPNVGSFVDSRLERGAVARTRPVGGAQLGSGSSVTIFVSDGTAGRG